MITFCIVATIVVYLAAMLFVGFAYSKSNEDSTDFYLGGRKMGPFVTAMSAEASDMSSWLLMGLPGLAYLSRHRFPGLDRHRPGRGHLAQLAHRGPAAAAVHRQPQRHHGAPVFVSALPRPAQSAQRTWVR